jgi:hypothetical protein
MLQDDESEIKSNTKIGGNFRKPAAQRICIF